MTDHELPANLTEEEVERARRWAEGIEANPKSWSLLTRTAARVVLDTVPAPTPPTLADMTPEERDACTGMQADLAQGDRVVILDGTPDHDGLVQVLEKSLDAYSPHQKDVTPRPDLPRLEWPGDTPTGPDHLAVGTVIESADDPRIAALPAGSILLDRDEEATTKWPGEWAGDGYIPIPSDGTEYGPWTVLHIPKEADQ